MKGYPRPQFRREQWINLNGPWDFCFDDDDIGLDRHYEKAFPKATQINVPFAYESKASGIHITKQHDIVWYRKRFSVESKDTLIILHFGAVDYKAMVFLNGRLLGEHVGGHTPFSYDITDTVISGTDNHLVVRVFDPMEALSIPRGKQYWKEQHESIYYTKTTGIWQTVWLEMVPKRHIESLVMTSDIDHAMLNVKIKQNSHESARLTLDLNYQGKTVKQLQEMMHADTIDLAIDLKDIVNLEASYWSPEQPNLYQLNLSLKTKDETDQVQSYIGLRKIHYRGNQVYLNNKPYQMRLVLDQGYYPESLLTSKSDDDLIQDIRLTKAMGFNGVRKHQKIEEERYLYYADKLGLLVWEEMPSAFEFTTESQQNLLREWPLVIKRDQNHPSIVAWVPINESWGVPDLMTSLPQVEFLNKLYDLTKTLDPTRLCVSNDGWEHGETDLFTIHDYESKYEVLKQRYQSIEALLASKPGYKELFVPGHQYENHPILVTEFGGISYAVNGHSGWGYSTAKDNDDFAKRLQNVFLPLYQSPLVKGFCYTQLTDVQQEINGLLTFDREPKIDINIIRKIVKNL